MRTVQVNKKWVFTGLMVALATVATYAAVTMQATPARAARRAIMTAKQAAVLSEPICRLLSHKPGELQQSIEEFYRVGGDGERHKIWVVDCVDSAGYHVVHTAWDAASGQLILAAHEPRRGTGRDVTAVKDHNVAQTAWRWMEAMGISHAAPKWKVSQPPHLVYASWYVVLSSPLYNATVIIDKDTHDLVYLSVKDKPQATHAL